MTKKIAVVTGGCGFIGSHLVKRLILEGFSVIVVDDMSSGKLENLHDKDIKFRVTFPEFINKFFKTASLKDDEVFVISGDFTDPDFISYIYNLDIEYVFHLAANPRVPMSVAYPSITTENNLQKSVDFITTFVNKKIKRFIFASSSAVYGNVNVFPTPEDSQKNPNSPYGLQKLCFEQFMSLYNKLYNIDCVALRFSNVYGPGADGESPYSTAIAAWCKNISANEDLRVDGDGEQTRDMIYVDDVVSGLLSCALRNENFGFCAMNLGTLTSISNNDIIKMLRSNVDCDFKTVNAPERSGDVKRTCLSIIKIQKETGWNAKTSISEGIKKTLSWWKISTKKTQNS